MSEGAPDSALGGGIIRDRRGSETAGSLSVRPLPTPPSGDEKGDKAWSDFEKSLEVLLKFKRDEDTSSSQPNTGVKGPVLGGSCLPRPKQVSVPGASCGSVPGVSCDTPRSGVYAARTTLPATPQNKSGGPRNPRTPINQSLSTPLHSPAPTPPSLTSPMLTAPPPIRSMVSSAATNLYSSGSAQATPSSNSFGKTVYSMVQANPTQQRRILFSQDQTSTSSASAVSYPYLPTSAIILSTPPPQIQIQSPPMPVYLPVRAVPAIKPVLQAAVQPVQARTENAQPSVQSVQPSVQSVQPSVQPSVQSVQRSVQNVQSSNMSAQQINSATGNHSVQQPICYASDGKVSFHGRNCQLCPCLPANYQGDVNYEETSLSEQAMFQCAGCGLKIEHYTEMESHVEKQHVGKDPVLVKASILVPNNLEYLKVHQCGIRTCSRRFVAQPEGVLKKHIRVAHGEFYVHMGMGRNILRICRICTDGTRYSTDLQLSEHLLTEHPTSVYANAECKDILPDSQIAQTGGNQRHSYWMDTESRVDRFVERCRRERSRSPFQSTSSNQWQEGCKKERHHNTGRSPTPTRRYGSRSPPAAPRSPTGSRWCTPTRRSSRRTSPDSPTVNRKRKISTRRSRTRTPTRCRTRSDCSSGHCSGTLPRSRSGASSSRRSRSRSPDYSWSGSHNHASYDRNQGAGYSQQSDRRGGASYNQQQASPAQTSSCYDRQGDCSASGVHRHSDYNHGDQGSKNCVKSEKREDSCEDLRQLILREKRMRSNHVSPDRQRNRASNSPPERRMRTSQSSPGEKRMRIAQPTSESSENSMTKNSTAVANKTEEINNNRFKELTNTPRNERTEKEFSKKAKKSGNKENMSPSNDEDVVNEEVVTKKPDVAKTKYENIAKPLIASAALSDKEYDLNANTENVDDSERTVTALGDVDSEKEKTHAETKIRSGRSRKEGSFKDKEDCDENSDDGKIKKKKRKKSSKHRRHSESSNSSSELSNKKRRKSRRSEKHHSNKHKKKKKKRDKKEVIKTEDPVELSAYCYACETYTHDWNLHKYMYKHIRNDKKARCLFCPQRIWFPQLKSHIKDTHRGASFVCNASETCFIRLMDLAKIVDHINTKHRKELDPLHKLTGQSGFVSPHLLAKHGLMILPADLKKLTCRLCDLYWLGQDKSLLEEHFHQEHPAVKKRDYEANIMFECRGCDGLLFGSQVYLLQHFKEIHSLGGFKPGPSDVSEDEMFQAISHNFTQKYETDARRLLQRTTTGGSKSALGMSTREARDISPSLITHRRRSFTPSPKPSIKLRLGLREDRSCERIRPMMGPKITDNGDNHQENAGHMQNSRIVRPLEQAFSQVYGCKSKNTEAERMLAIGLNADVKPKKREPCLFCEKSLLSTRLENHQNTKHYDLMFHCVEPACATAAVSHRTRSKSQSESHSQELATGSRQELATFNNKELLTGSHKELMTDSLQPLTALDLEPTCTKQVGDQEAEKEESVNMVPAALSRRHSSGSSMNMSGGISGSFVGNIAVLSPWKSEIITHLRTFHLREEGDDELAKKFVKMPVNLKMVICKVMDCDSAVYLGRSPSQVRLDMASHVTTSHPSMKLESCFSLACRGCGYVLDMEKEKDWILHISKDHSLPGVPKRIRSVSFSNIEYRSDSESSSSEAKPTTPNSSTGKINIIQAIKGIQEVSVGESVKDMIVTEDLKSAGEEENGEMMKARVATDSTNSDSAQFKIGNPFNQSKE